MDKQLQLIQCLYNDEADHDAHRRLLAEDAEYGSAFRSLSEVRFALDHRPRRTPAPSLTERVVRAAAEQHPVRAQRASRTARPPVRRRTLALVAGIACGILLIVLRFPVTTDAPVVVPRAPAASASAPEPQLRLGGAPDDVLRWDAGTEVRHLQGHVDLVRSRTSPSAWDTVLPAASF